MARMRRIAVSSTFKFEAAHKLPHYVGKCADLHGHTYVLRVLVSGAIDTKDQSGIILDFGKVKEVVNENIINVYDHKYLNDFFDTPSAEVMVEFFFSVLEKALSQRYPKIELEMVRLYEGGGQNYAEARRDGFV